ncbi:MAG: hypothetical protein J3Q66DRAFT_401801 [Benniella sp.]|nr:MAG: hypothetical protein J3Q66DRAFT_401801 [Benniella sp.]
MTASLRYSYLSSSRPFARSRRYWKRGAQLQVTLSAQTTQELSRTNTSLPEWLSLNASHRVLTGTVPKDSPSRIILDVQAVDSFNTTSTFKLQVFFQYLGGLCLLSTSLDVWVKKTGEEFRLDLQPTMLMAYPMEVYPSTEFLVRATETGPRDVDSQSLHGIGPLGIKIVVAVALPIILALRFIVSRYGNAFRRDLRTADQRGETKVILSKDGPLVLLPEGWGAAVHTKPDGRANDSSPRRSSAMVNRITSPATKMIRLWAIGTATVKSILQNFNLAEAYLGKKERRVAYGLLGGCFEESMDPARMSVRR